MKMMDKAVALEENGVVNHDPFEVFFLQNYKKVYGILYRLTGQAMDADVVMTVSLACSSRFSTLATGGIVN